MVEEDDTVYVRTQSGIYSIGDGFTSTDEIEEHIENEYTPGEYEYGTFSAVGEHAVPEPEPKTKTMSEAALRRRDAIQERAAADDRVNAFAAVDSPNRSFRASVYTHTIRYDGQDVDFSFAIRNDEFDDVPLSTLDSSTEADVRGIFNDVAQEDAMFLGFNSGYARRGRRDPYVRVYGRVKRDTEKERQLRELIGRPEVAGAYLSEDNISAVRVGVEEPTDENYEANDYILILKAQNDVDTYDKLGENAEARAQTAIETVEESYDYRVPWVGLVEYDREFMHVCLGIEYVGDD